MKKGKYQVEMQSSDIYFANRQVDRLFEKLLKTKGKLRVVLPSIDAEKIEKETKEQEKQRIINEIVPDRINTQEKKEVISTPKEEPKETVIEIKEVAKKVEEIFEKPAETAKTPKEEPKEIVVEIKETVKKTDEPIQKPSEPAKIEKAVEVVEEIEEQEEPETYIEEATEEAEIKEEAIKEGIQGNLFENILAEKTQELNENMEEEEPPVKEVPKIKKTFTFKSIITEKVKSPTSEQSSNKQKAGFKSSEKEEDKELTKILEEKIKKNLPKSENKAVYADEQEITGVDIIEPDLTYEEEYDEDGFTTQEFESLGELIAIKKPQSKLDYLLLTAYYLQTSESLFKYSLKQLNAKAMPFLGSLIDHSIIHNAVAHDFIEVVPDYNGTSEVTEYRLTQHGEDYLINEL